ncbi:MAG TPA: prepilin-type N-terminal cleavage/methylation domain-containing protein [Thermoanaerobaculia bacterium]|jgi:general secretion pathway protein G|nr:prepilin-type N-terminal cleavage/methylation domain-containing protein [Thermoanaerobaculia bacterium]
MKRRSSAGFTLAELITVCAIIVVLTGIALPIARFGLRRRREEILRERLSHITFALDRYAELRQRGQIKTPPELGQGEYPKKLEDLTKPVELLDGKKMVLLRERDLIDPITGQNDWQTLSSTDSYDAISTNGDNVWDVRSSSRAKALNGTPYNEW